jgi:hypothetical protein
LNTSLTERGQKQSSLQQAPLWIARGACQRERIRPTRRLAVTDALLLARPNWPDGQITKSLSTLSRKNISFNPSGKSLL